MSWTRRQFMQRSGGALAAASVLGFPSILRAAGPVWGGVPASVWATPPDIKILEIHLLGGMAPFESFYFRPTRRLRTRGFDAEIAELSWNTANTDDCSGTRTDIGTPAITSQFHGDDSNRKSVHLGPFAKPLWPAHIASRMRVIVHTESQLVAA